MSVDAVFLLAAHSDYRTSEKGQKLYPRYEFFQKIVDIFRQDDAAVAVFKTRTSRIALKRLSVWCCLEGVAVPVFGRLLTAGHLSAAYR